MASKDLLLIGKSDSGPNPSWISTHPLNSSILLSTNEENPIGGLSTFMITDRANGVVERISNASSFGADPAYLAALSSARQVAVMNFSSGNGTFIPLGEDLLTLDEPQAQKITFDAPVSNPHQVVEIGDEILIPDLGADKVWRLKQEPSTGQDPVPNWKVRGFVQQPAGSGPRHIAVHEGILYTLHEKASTLSSQTLPPLDSGAEPKTISTFSVLPPGANQSAFAAAELVLDEKRKLLYASNRDLSPSPDPRGDAIAIFSFDCDGNLEPTNQVFTGLNRIRAMAHGGPDNVYIAAAGQAGGGLAVFEKVNNTLVDRARLPAGSIDEPASFVWL
ncbi:hypothetical protein FRC12_004160 [Ceratobasidium sp. 428]|nr:hypothetical protein FRC12_004160 [Ceratobasidium sp. 428]